MLKFFRKPKNVRPNFNPNLIDTINNLRVPVLAPSSHQSQQHTHIGPTFAQHPTTVDVVTSRPSSSAPDLMNPTPSTIYDQMQVDVSHGQPSYTLVNSTSPSTSTTQELLQDDVVPVLPARQRRGCNSSRVSIGQDQAFNQVCDFLSNGEVGMVGIYGMGGVGKTTLLKKIRNEFLEPSNFKVIWLVVSKSSDVDNIQKDIMEEMNLPFNKDEHCHKRAEKISKALDEMEVALLFDDIWEFLDLEGLGLDTFICKIIFTTRSEKVCTQMQPDRKIKVKCLGWDDSWALFKKSVGEETFQSDRRIECLAKEVAKECKGLPLALTIIGRAMTCKKCLQEWKHALTTLQKSPLQGLDTEENLFVRLKLSYDALPDRGEKDCFLYCCLYPEDWEMYKEDLVQYWIGEGFLRLDGSYEEAHNRGYDIIGTLLAASLLEKDGDQYVKMHDVIRDMGLWFASKMKLIFFVHEGTQLTKEQIADRWREAHRIYVVKGDKLPQQPLCLNLSTLIFDNDPKIKISNDFFKSMCNIRVLKLACIEFLDPPLAIGQLSELRYLIISDTNMKTLPTEIGNLSKLEVLDLCRNSHLMELPETIGQLVELRRLTVTPCLKPFRVELGSLSKLEILEMIFEELPDSGDVEYIRHLSNSLRRLWMRNWPITNEDELLSALQNMEKLSVLEIEIVPLKTFSCSSFSSLEELSISECSELEKIEIGQTDLRNLWKLEIIYCTSLKYISGHQHLQGLVDLTIAECAMEELIKADEEVKEGRICFPNLKIMKLRSLFKLKSICSDVVLFPSLTRFVLYDCPNLEKLPRGLMNENRTLKEGKIGGTREWWTRFMWQDEDFKSFIETNCETPCHSRPSTVSPASPSAPPVTSATNSPDACHGLQ